ncbi:MAG: fecCD transport family protein [Rhizobacter sp.]|nr:fecCD transport family protein [Rhizobacter sp.]
MNAPRGSSVMMALAFAGVAAVAFGLASGSSGIGWASGDIFWSIRLPRVLCGFGVGAALALSGALAQGLTRNALADPYVLGISGGAAVGALGAMVLGGFAGLAIEQEWLVMVGASVGAVGAALLLFGLSWRMLQGGSRGGAAGQDTSVSLLLVGVMIGSASSAVVALLLSVAPEAQLRGMVFWLLGDLNGATQWKAVWMAVVVAFALAWPWSRELDWLARGDAWAASLGVPVARRRRQAMLAASIATGAAVAVAGAIGFVGLVVPHALRMAGLRSSVALLPASALVGGAFVVLVDACARTLIAPVQLPVGALMAIIGVPVFLVLLLQRRAR